MKVKLFKKKHWKETKYQKKGYPLERYAKGYIVKRINELEDRLYGVGNELLIAKKYGHPYSSPESFFLHHGFNSLDQELCFWKRKLSLWTEPR